MPAVTVSSLGSIAVTSTYIHPNTRIIEEMSQEGGNGGNDNEGPGVGKKDDPSAVNKNGEDPNDGGPATRKGSIPPGGTVSPSQSNAYPQALPAHLTPQQQPGYYVGYNSQVTPEPPSPAGPGGAGVYDVGSFFQQPTGFHSSPFAAGAPHQYGVSPGPQQQQQPPHSPSQNTSGSMVGLPPASPLFPRVGGQAASMLDQQRMLDGSIQQRGAPLSPGPPYLTPPLGPSATAMYPSMGGYGGPNHNGSTNSNSSPDDMSAWNDNRRNTQSPYPHNSPQISAQGIPIPYVPGMPPRTGSAGSRSYSFEDTMLPPSAESQQQQQQQQQDHNLSYSPYGANQNGGIIGSPATLFAQQQQWGYGGPPPDMYGSGSPLQPRPTMPYPGLAGGPPRHHHHPPPHMGPYGGQFYPATSPGPPIQTTASNKGPDGANLFIFHIPNHFTNLDMYQLFCPYGNLLSVRIMVEKDTGRSRGFGFVSYDSPDAAALAIKELNGFAIGNKRLKVQHKQIRPSDQQHDRSHNNNSNNNNNNNNSGYGDNMGGPHSGGGGYGRGHMSSSLPPSGPMAMNAGWYNNRTVSQVSADANQGGVNTESSEKDDHPNASNNGQADGNRASDPLSNLEPLRQNLPDVGGTGDQLK